jgi:hypothetical protein
MKRATRILAVLAVLLALVSPASADFIYDASGTFDDGVGDTFTLSGTVTFNNTGGLVSADLLVKSLDGMTTYIDTKAGKPPVSLSTLIDINGTVYDQIFGITANHATFISLLFLPPGIGGSSPVEIVPFVSLGDTGELSEFGSPIGSPNESPTFAGLTSGQLTPQGTSSVPEPSALTLFGLGSLGLAGYGRRRRKQAAA